MAREISKRIKRGAERPPNLPAVVHTGEDPPLTADVASQEIVGGVDVASFRRTDWSESDLPPKRTKPWRRNKS
jgi:hypothetical protein